MMVMQKSFLTLLCSLVIISMLLPQILFAGSLLQISAEPGVSIWLNKEFVGKTTEGQNGLVIADITPGEYQLKASMPKYDPVETQIKIVSNQTIEWRIKFAKPVMQVEESVKRIDSSMIRSEPTGTIIFKSIPLNAAIFFDNAPIGTTDKKLTYVPVAEHTVKFVFQESKLIKKFALQADESLLLRADFMKGEIVEESVQTDTNLGRAVIKMPTSRKRKVALFPHRKHQERFECANCHHGMDNEGKQIPYNEGMEIQHCVTCHNSKMKNKYLNSLMQAAHARCKGCHRKIVAESGTAGPIEKCIGCHNIPDEK